MSPQRKPRIALEPHALRVLRIWAAIEDKDPGGLVSELIFDHIPARVRDALGENTPKPPDPPRRAAIESNRPERKKRLAESPDAIAAIKEMWSRSPRPSLMEMAKELDYPKATVADNVRRMRASGELMD
jgi:hypothetical protein